MSARPPHLRRTSAHELIRFTAIWVLGGALAAIGLVFLLGRLGDDVTLPPVRETDIVAAARDGGCDLITDRSGELPGDPPTHGPAGTAAAEPGAYPETPSDGALVAAMRRGIVVIEYRGDIGERRFAQLELVRARVPSGTILAPAASDMPWEVAVLAWRRILACRKFNDATLDAIRLFRVRNLDRGPESATG